MGTYRVERVDIQPKYTGRLSVRDVPTTSPSVSSYISIFSGMRMFLTMVVVTTLPEGLSLWTLVVVVVPRPVRPVTPMSSSSNSEDETGVEVGRGRVDEGTKHSEPDYLTGWGSR